MIHPDRPLPPPTVESYPLRGYGLWEARAGEVTAGGLSRQQAEYRLRLKLAQPRGD